MEFDEKYEAQRDFRDAVLKVECACDMYEDGLPVNAVDDAVCDLLAAIRDLDDESV